MRGRRSTIQQVRRVSSEAPDLDGEVSSAAEIVAIVENEANAGNSYWMRGGDYGEMDLGEDARPSSLITFTTYPGEQVTFEDVSFFRSANMRFDGNEANMVREPSTQDGAVLPDGEYGLWFRGSGIAGNDIPPVNNALTFHASGPTDWNENIQFAHFRVGDDAAVGDFPDDTPWRRQHGIVITAFSRDLLFEDFEIAYIGCDLNGEGDSEAGGFGLWFSSTGDPEWGSYTIRRGHWHHTNNDFIQYDAKNPSDGLCLFEDCLFEELYNYGAAHADFFQSVGGTTQLTFDGCVFQYGTDFLLHGNNPGATRLFNNCLIGNPNGVDDNAHQIVLGKEEELGPSPGLGADSYEWRNCTILCETNGIRTDSTLGASFTSDFVIANSIYRGVQTETGVNFDNCFSTDGEPNLYETGSTATMLDGDSTGTPVYNADAECTNFSQGWRMPASFPWTL